MSVNIKEFVRLRPYVFHISARENGSFLRGSRRLFTTLSLLEVAGRKDLAFTRRTDCLTLELPLGRVTLKDQKPLIEANTQLLGGWSFPDFVHYLNGKTYFWPGTESGPIGPGRRLLEHYEMDGPLVLRMKTIDLFAANPNLAPLFSPFNSGAPRYHSGQKAVRGPDLFTAADDFPRRASEVVELAFADNTLLPESTEYRPQAGWTRFFDSII